MMQPFISPAEPLHSTLIPALGSVDSHVAQGRARIQLAFRWACGLDVAVRKPGNVSIASSGHGMSAGQFLDSATAAAAPLTSPGASVGARIEGAIQASWAAVGCNTNLGIVLLCAPLAAAAEVLIRTDSRINGIAAPSTDAPKLASRLRQLQQALQTVLAGLDVDDAAAALRAVTLASPREDRQDTRQDLRQPANLSLRAAMTLAAPSDRIARQYHEDYLELFELGLPIFQRALGTERAWPQVLPAGLPQLSPALENATQRCFLLWLASGLDTHLVRQHGADVAHSVTVQARGWRMRLPEPLHGPDAREWARWDDLLKSRSLNPITSADLTVTTAFLAALLSVI